MKAPVYIVKPKNIFRHPFNKFDLDKPMNRQSQNEDLTDYFNYGFNEDTMNIYSKMVKRTIEVLDESINPTYFDAPSQLMRLNDQIPMDFGGFCKFFDTSVFVNPQGNQGEEEDYMIDYHNATSKNQPQNQTYPLIDFVKCMYRNLVEGQAYQVCDVMDQIEQNLERKYQQTMKKLYEKKNNPGGTSTGNNAAQEGNNQKNKNKKNNDGQVPDIVKEMQNLKKQEKADHTSQSESSSSDSESDSSSESSSESDRKKKSKNRSGRSKSRSTKKDKKSSKGKTKKISKDDRKEKSKKSKQKSKSKKKSRSEERGRKGDKSKKRRN